MPNDVNRTPSTAPLPDGVATVELHKHNGPTLPEGRLRRVSGVMLRESDEDGRRSLWLEGIDPDERYPLSRLGRRVWEALDGQPFEGVLARVAATSSSTPEALRPLVWGVVRGLLDAGVAEEDATPHAARRQLAPQWCSGLTKGLRRLFMQRLGRGEADALFSRMYEAGGRWLFHPLVAVALGVVASSGTVAFLTATPTGASPWGPWRTALLFVGALWAGTFPAELVRGLTIKHVGREVRGVGIRGSWLGPVPFVDGSDLVLATRREHRLSHLAAPFASMLVGALIALLPAIVGHAPSAWAWARGAWIVAGAQLVLACITLAASIVVEAVAARERRHRHARRKDAPTNAELLPATRDDEPTIQMDTAPDMEPAASPAPLSIVRGAVRTAPPEPPRSVEDVSYSVRKRTNPSDVDAELPSDERVAG